MSTRDNTRVVQEIYESFGRGDIPTILNALAPDVQWHFHGPTEIPFAGKRRGREQMAEFFKTVSETVEVQQFGPTAEFIVQGDYVVVLGHERVRAKMTGRTWETGWVHVWKFRGGQVAKLDEFYDTAAIVAALRGR